MRRSTMALVALLIASACAAPTSGGGQTGDSGPQSGGTLRVAVPADFGILDPHLSASLADHQAIAAIYAPLVDVDPALKIVPALAESWSIPDATTYVFKLRSGAMFHDGTPVDAAAIEWNFDRILDPATKSLRAAELAAIQDVTVVDPLTVRVTLKNPFPAFLATLADRARPVSPAAVEKYGADFARNPVGAGPFQFKEWVKNDHLTLTRFAGYWGKDAAGRALPYLDEVRFLVMPDDATRLTSLRTGSIEVMDTVAPKDVATIKADRDLVYSEVPGVGYNRLGINVTRPPLDNKALRQAIAYAIDRTVIHEVIYLETGRVGESLIPPTNPYWDEDFEIYGTTADLEMARQKLAEGGRPDGFEFELAIENLPLHVQLAELIKSQLEQVGIVATIVPSEAAAFVSRVVKSDFTAFRSTTSGGVDMDTLMQAFIADGPLNFFKYQSAEATRLLREARASIDDEERKDLYRRAQRIILEDAPVLVLHYEALQRATRADVKGFDPVPDGKMRFTSVWLAR